MAARAASGIGDIPADVWGSGSMVCVASPSRCGGVGGPWRLYHARREQGWRTLQLHPQLYGPDFRFRALKLDLTIYNCEPVRENLGTRSRCRSREPDSGRRDSCVSPSVTLTGHRDNIFSDVVWLISVRISRISRSRGAVSAADGDAGPGCVRTERRKLYADDWELFSALLPEAGASARVISSRTCMLSHGANICGVVHVAWVVLRIVS